MPLFRKKPVVIEAMRFDGTHTTADEIRRWAHEGLHPQANSIVVVSGFGLSVRTLEGEMYATSGDWIIKGVMGEFYPCKPDIFAATYEPVEAPPDHIAGGGKLITTPINAESAPNLPA